MNDKEIGEMWLMLMAKPLGHQPGARNNADEVMLALIRKLIDERAFRYKRNPDADGHSIRQALRDFGIAPTAIAQLKGEPRQ